MAEIRGARELWDQYNDDGDSVGPEVVIGDGVDNEAVEAAYRDDTIYDCGGQWLSGIEVLFWQHDWQIDHQSEGDAHPLVAHKGSRICICYTNPEPWAVEVRGQVLSGMHENQVQIEVAA